jgi:5-formyltetrahydrofolate cyclo-ligase
VASLFCLRSPSLLANSFCRAAMSTTASADDIRNQKQILRKEIRPRLRRLTNDDIQIQSQQVWDRLFQLPAYQQAQSVGLFISMPGGEINTDAALQHAILNGKQIYVPQVGKNFEQADMELIRVAIPENLEAEIFYHSWPRNKWGIPEPPADMPLYEAAPGDIDVLVMPGLAFDRNGNRLGQGKGYYDRFIARIVSAGAKSPTLVAVGLDCQLVDSIPVQEYDQRADLVLLPSQMIEPYLS